MSGRQRVAMFLPALAGGGAERVVLNLAAGFATRGFATDLVLAQAEGPYLPMVPANVRVVDLKAPRVLRSVMPLAAYLRRERPAAMLAALDHANVVAIAASKLAGVGTRTVISVHCTFPKHRVSDIKVKTLPWLLGRMHPWADAVVAVSEGVADDIVRTIGIPRERIDVIYNPVITPELRPAAALPPSHAWLNDTSRPVLLGIGRLTPQKNFPLLIEAFSRVRARHHARLLILGEGPERPALEAQVQALGLEDDVALPGFLDNPYSCMSRAAVLVLSSDFEGLPTVLIEGLALGTPIVATDCESGPREILRDGVLGELVRVGDAGALADAISRSLVNPRRLDDPRVLESYTLDAALDRFETTFQLHG